MTLEDRAFPQPELRERLVVLGQCLDFTQTSNSQIALELKHEEARAAAVLEFRLFGLERLLGKNARLPRRIDALKIGLGQLQRVINLNEHRLLKLLQLKKSALVFGPGNLVIVPREAVAERNG